MNYRNIMDDIYQEAISGSNFYKELNDIAATKDKTSFTNKLISKYKCDFENANIVAEYFIDKKSLPLTPEQVERNQQQSAYYASLPKCQYCKSTNIKKIGVVSRSVSIGMFGLASGKVGKQWHCNNCNSDF